MVKITNNSVNGIYGVNEYCADSPQDLNDHSLVKAEMGSVVYIISNGELYMKDSAGSWIKQ